MKEWQFNVLFVVGVLGAVFLLVGPSVGVNVTQNPIAVSGVGAILSYVLTQKKIFTKHDDKKPDPPRKEGDEPDDS